MNLMSRFANVESAEQSGGIYTKLLQQPGDRHAQMVVKLQIYKHDAIV